MVNVNGRKVGEEGGSLAELTTVLAVIGILATMAIPSYRSMIARAEGRSVAVEIAAELRLARQLAMARRERLAMRFEQAGRHITCKRADSGEVIKTYHYEDKAVTIPEPTAGPEVLFHPSGRSATATTITIINREGSRTVLTVSLTGRVSLS